MVVVRSAYQGRFADQLLLELGLEIQHLSNRRFGGAYYARYIILAANGQLSIKRQQTNSYQIENFLQWLLVQSSLLVAVKAEPVRRSFVYSTIMAEESSQQQEASAKFNIWKPRELRF